MVILDFFTCSVRVTDSDTLIVTCDCKRIATSKISLRTLLNNKFLYQKIVNYIVLSLRSRYQSKLVLVLDFSI